MSSQNIMGNFVKYEYNKSQLDITKLLKILSYKEIFQLKNMHSSKTINKYFESTF